jgi:hypothetical protein
MKDAMTIWEGICQSQWFKCTSMVCGLPSRSIVQFDILLQILFLNKNDLFQKKIADSNIKNFFPVSLPDRGCSLAPYLFLCGRITMANPGTSELVENILGNILINWPAKEDGRENEQSIYSGFM